MKIVIMGARRVGESVAESLVSKRNDLTAIDTDPDRRRSLPAFCERLPIEGDALIAAGRRETDLKPIHSGQGGTALTTIKTPGKFSRPPDRLSKAAAVLVRPR